MREDRPWGHYYVLSSFAGNPGFQVKRLVLDPGKQFSLQSHDHRDEYWVVVKGLAIVTLGSTEYKKGIGEVVKVPKTMIHRAMNPGLEELIIIETQIGNPLSEDDIHRYKDDFGRPTERYKK